MESIQDQIDRTPHRNEPFSFENALTGSRLFVGERRAPNPSELLYPPNPSVGLVISTFGSAPYVALALEARKRLCPSVAVLVHDDASDEREPLKQLCVRYGADLQVNSARLGHQMGDLSAIVGGLAWANKRGLDLLVKMSRRFIPTTDWVTSFVQTAVVSQYATIGRGCQANNFPIRTECFGMAVKPWCHADIMGKMTDLLLTNRAPMFAEEFVATLATKVHESACGKAREFENNGRRAAGPKHVIAHRPSPVGGWGWLVPNRMERSPNYFWHETHRPSEYADLARQLGLTYTVANFEGIWSQGGT